jgi:hypothetical protein
VQLTGVVPTLKLDPLAGVHVTVGVESHVSVAVTVKLTGTGAPDGEQASMFPGQLVMVGAVESAIVMVNEHISMLPSESVAVQTTVFGPTGKVEPDAGTQATTGDGSQASEATALA